MKQAIEQAVVAAVQHLYSLDVSVSLTRPDEQFGDYATNVALQLSKQVGENPREIAEALRTELLVSLEETVSDISVAGPGFMNLRLAEPVLHNAITDITSAGSNYGKPTIYQGKKILVEYSDPNPLKPLHAGHLYTTLVGDSISRLLEVSGADVVRLNYGGDVGRHIGISLWAIIREIGGELPEKLDAIAVNDRPTWLGARYVEGTAAFEDDEQAKQETTVTNKRVYQIYTDNDHESPFAQIYWTVRQWSYDYFKLLYEQLQVKPFDRFLPESEVFQLGLDTVKEQLAKGVYTESQGAVVFEGEQYGLHTRVFINSAGMPTYETKDVGLIQRKWEDYHYDESIVITANEQVQYYEVMLKSVEQFAPELVRRSKHHTHGVVTLQGGVKMSSRKGNIVSALEIIAAARQAGAESGRNPSEDTTLAAIKYAFAKNRIGGDIAYDPKESIALEGNSGPYLQYASVRAKHILDKSTGVTKVESWKLNDSERSLIRKMTEWPEVLEQAATELMPHIICTYLYELAQTFNRFYEQNQVIGNELEANRSSLVAAYYTVLTSGLELLGIVSPDDM